MRFFLRAFCLAIFSLLVCTLWAPASEAEYWSHPFIGKCRASGFECARLVYVAIYGANPTGTCFYSRDDYYGYIGAAVCKGSRGWGNVNLNCETGEVKSTNGCIDKPIVDKDPPCETQTGNPVDASSGMKLEYALDFTTSGPLPLKFERHYRSETNTKDGEYKTSRLGTGWRSNFDAAKRLRSITYRGGYAHSNPVMNIDPDGKFAIALPFAISGNRSHRGHDDRSSRGISRCQCYRSAPRQGPTR